MKIRAPTLFSTYTNVTISDTVGGGMHILVGKNSKMVEKELLIYGRCWRWILVFQIAIY